MILNYIEKNGRIKREEVMELCMLTKDQAWKLLRKLKESNKIVQIGERKTTYFGTCPVLADGFPAIPSIGLYLTRKFF
jgi:ATP-dependent DNA helicase RecG